MPLDSLSNHPRAFLLFPTVAGTRNWMQTKAWMISDDNGVETAQNWEVMG